MLKKFPGFIDVHVHLREPGATHKEDFHTGSRAAVNGGFTHILDMPNNPIPTFTPQALADKISLSQKAVCDIGFHYGTNGRNTTSFEQVGKNPRVFGLKVYCNHTTGDYLVEDPLLLEAIFGAWNAQKPILVHAEGERLRLVIELAKKHDRQLHVCHISLLEEVTLVKQAKQKKQKISAGVTPHHLFLSEQNIIQKGAYALMKPPINPKDQTALWEGLLNGTIDLIETDHAPHTKKEKETSNPSFGVPGLETAAGLLFKAAKEGKIKEEQIITWLYDRPKAIFAIPDQRDTFIELDPDQPFIMGKDGYETKCGWSPFDKWELYGQTKNVTIRGKKILENCHFIV